jgi:PIN domain nuclease of toxin-antitoxin system
LRDDGAAPRHPRLPLVHHIYLSVASIWEAVIKYHLGKLPLPAPPADFLPRQREEHGIASLPIDEGAMTHLAGLSPLHRDPFDRLLVAQALQHGLTIATVDPEVAAYPVLLLPAAIE